MAAVRFTKRWRSFDAGETMLAVSEDVASAWVALGVAEYVDPNEVSPPPPAAAPLGPDPIALEPQQVEAVRARRGRRG